jgi:glycosyltransferase involved in cell wall biosynthesis
MVRLSAGTTVQFLGPKTQPELAKIYQESGYFINTSLTHSMDKTVLEAMLCGCVPLTANKAFRDMLQPFGLFFEEQDARAYSERILKDDTESVRAALHQSVVTHHSLDTFADRIFII